MALVTYSFDLDGTNKSVFITDDVLATTTVEVRVKSSNALIVSAPLATWQAMVRNITEWSGLRAANDLISFSKV